MGGRAQVFPDLAVWSSSPQEAFLLPPVTPQPASKVAARVIHLKSKSLSLPCRVPGGSPVPTGLSSSPLPRLLLSDSTCPPCICLAGTSVPSTWCSVPCCSPEHPVSSLLEAPAVLTLLHTPACASLQLQLSLMWGWWGQRLVLPTHLSPPMWSMLQDPHLTVFLGHQQSQSPVCPHKLGPA